MNLPEFLKLHRKNHSLAQKQVAHTLGITREHYARVERGTQLPSLPLLRRIAKKFQVTIVYIISEDEGISRTLINLQ
jgi:transcriptional regulator with XRE-family HTH domain